MLSVCLIIAGAGRSSRFGGAVGKTYELIGSKPVFLWSVDRFSEFSQITQRLLVVGAEDLAMVGSKWGGDLADRGVELVAGGERRFDSVSNALGVVAASVDLVAVHDGARPAVSTSAISRAFAQAEATGAAIVARQVNETLKRSAPDGLGVHVADRSSYWLAQTPQVFRRELLMASYSSWSGDKGEPTDDAQVVEAYGQRAELVEAGSDNIKITTPGDLKLAESILR